ncbi:MAG: DUF11 domain-containing protein, partial [Planctomycetales bacterium]|nr:DUF11 domain-containing protein [Planctomycetales bacterium]
MKRWVAVASSLAALGGVGYAGYSQRDWLLDATPHEEHAEHTDEASQPAPPQPIALTAVEASEPSRWNAGAAQVQPLASSPYEATVVRGNHEDAPLPAPRFGAAVAAADAQVEGEARALPPISAPPAGAFSLSDRAASSNSVGALAPPPTYPSTAEAAPPVGSDQTALGGSSFSRQGLSDSVAQAPAVEPAPAADLPETYEQPRFGGGLSSNAPEGTSRFGALGAAPVAAAEPAAQVADNGSRYALPPVGSGLAGGSLSAAPAATIAPRAAPAAGGALTGGSAIEGSARPGPRELDGPQSPSLLVEKFAPAEIQIGKPAKFEIKVRNVGQAKAENVVVRDQIPQGTRLIDATPAASGGGDSVVFWQLGDLAPGEENTVSIQLMPVGEGEIGSVATVTFTAQASTRTKCTRPQLLLEANGPRQVLVGGNVNLTIRLSNPGSGAATRVVLEEDVPEGLSHPGGAALEFEAGTLKPGETRDLELTLKADKAGVVRNIIRARAEANLSVEALTDIEVIAPQLALNIEGPTKRYLERQASHELVVQNPGTAPA